MRALTLRQPWADLIVWGGKDVENRTWPVPSTLPTWTACPRCGERIDTIRCESTKHPGTVLGVDDGPFPFTIAVHAGLSEEPDHYGRAWQAWRELDLRRPPHAGAVVGTVDVVGCHHADDERGIERRGLEGRPVETFTPCSRWAEPNAWHWQLANPTALDEPIPARGHQSLWTLPDDVAAAVLAS